MYRVKVKDQDVATIDSPKSWGEVFKVGDKTVFPYYTKGKCIFGRWHEEREVLV